VLTLLKIEEPRAAASRQFALWDLGFRPFYLVASVLAALSVPMWALQFTGWLGHSVLRGPVWHAHEMVFGFALAVIVGFLFTAGRNWTNQPTPTGPALMALVGLWLTARVLVLTPFGWASAIVNVAFPWSAAAALAVPFLRAKNRRNYFFVGLLVLMGVASGAVHLSELGALELPAWAGLQLGLDVVLFVLVVMGGRVIPMFTNNGVPGAGASRHAVVEKLALGGVLLLAAIDLVGWRGEMVGLLSLVVGVVHGVRWLMWRPWKAARAPLVWVLHLAYVWVPLHLVLRAVATFELTTPSVAAHALTAGAIGGLIIGMMTRTAKGHTGRPLRADRWDVACYALVLTGAAIRVVVPMVAPMELLASLLISAALWSGGFALFAIRYWAVLSRARLDGKPG